MAHFAELDDENKVLRVVVIDDADTRDPQGAENEAIGASFCRRLFGGRVWVQTSYNDSMRTRFAGVGDEYDAVRDAFIPEKDYPSFVFNEALKLWEPPVKYPGDGNDYKWNEDQQRWDLAGS